MHWFGITIIPVQPWLQPYTSFFHDAHVYGAYTIAGLLAFHIVGVLKHSLIDHDGVLRGLFHPFDPERRPDPTKPGTKPKSVMPFSAE